jgi:UPF0271 protein
MDLNADLAEFDEMAAVRAQEPFYRLVTSANIACGGHAGTPDTMREALELCALRRVAPGAHPSYEDRPAFGRSSYATSPDLVRRLFDTQVGALLGAATSLGVTLRHVKAHGTLYHDIAHRTDLAEAAVLALGPFPPPLRLYGPPDCALSHAAATAGIPYVTEGFPDRRYARDGRLLPRSHPDSVVHDPDEAAAYALLYARNKRFDTLCIHADHEGSLARLTRIHHLLTSHGIVFAAP